MMQYKRKRILQAFCRLFLFLLSSVQCYSIDKLNMLDKVDLKHEKRYPNGTVVGKYNYVDKEGNPVQVKYFADDTSYGVELKSVKVLDPNNGHTSEHSEKQSKIDNLLQTLGSSVDPLPDLYNTMSYPASSDKNKFPQPANFNKENHYKTNYKTSPDYEIYLQNELQAPKKCGKDKVRIYIDKGKRKIREVLNDVATFKHCDQF